MNSLVRREKLRRGAWGIALLVLATGVCLAKAEVSVVHYPDGREIGGTVVGVGERDFQWKLEGSGDVQSTPYSNITWIEFPALDGWEEAQLAFEDGQYEEAAKYFDKVASVRYSGNYHPAPGNFATLAQLRALECHRRLVNLEQIVALARLFEPELLPPTEKDPGAIIDAWVAVGAENWDKAKEIVDAIGGIEADSREAIELGFLRGIVLCELGKPDLGLTELAKTYTINLGTEPGIAEAAIRKSVEVLISLELLERMPEVKGLVQLYAGIYGGQKLWPGASAELTGLLEKETQMEFVAGKAREEEGQLELIKAEAKSGEENVLFRVDFDPERRRGNLSDPEFCIIKKEDGTYEFKGENRGHTYTMTGSQATAEDIRYEEGATYAFSITGYAPEGSELAKCAVELGYEKKGKFHAIKTWEDYAASGAKEGFENRRRIEVTATVGRESADAVGKPIAIRISGSGGNETRFLSDGVIEKKG